MPGRGLDQILPHPGRPELRENLVNDARTYVAFAERRNGLIPRPTGFSWPWGEALPLLTELAPDVRLVNLETSVTSDGEFAPGKAVHYRMNPANLGCLTVARPDVCVLANNHVLDFGPQGLEDTLTVLGEAGLRGAGAGRDAERAGEAAVVALPSGPRVVLVAGATESSGVPPDWAATAERPGVAFIPVLSRETAAELAARALAGKRPGDLTVVSLHWGSNWGYQIPSGQHGFAHRLIDAGVDLVYGHSSHHPRPIEVYRGKLILYGCGDLINDYEGISGYENYRGDLRLLYFASVERDTGELVSLRMLPLRARRMRLEHAPGPDAEWLRAMLDRTSHRFSTRIDRDSEGMLALHPA
jgi:poly-gamma-glutamate capsule biosynthesis protein CapA/YwtB (metallophosphatase superfamily)